MPTEAVTPDSLSGDVILISSITLLTAIIAKVVAANLISSLKKELERLEAIRGRVRRALGAAQQRRSSLVGIQTFYQRRKTEMMAERGLSVDALELYETKDEELGSLEERRKEALAELEFAAREARDATDENAIALYEKRRDLATQRLEQVEQELEDRLNDPVVEPEAEPELGDER